ncbi:MAG TPA: hypothetical protein PKY29_02895 [Ferruginibacter sp.]|nr:hypothetical protein [Ferruginibacter sp.]HRO16859.1 hypothetical protein [Ferruginibacter sp.]HRQ20231.1 hypothetical protein [Ferruginibacter sp.]
MSKVQISEIAQHFSTGVFYKVYDFISEDACWEVVVTSCLNGKSAIIDNCKKVAEYFNTVQTEFTIQNVVMEGNKVVVNGTARFRKDEKILSIVSACDLYMFNDEHQLTNIISYCITINE